MLDKSLSIITILRVSDTRTVSTILYPDSKNPHSAVVQTQKHLNALVMQGKLRRGSGFYALPEYRGEYKEHDRAVTKCIARLVLTKLPISIYREVSFPVGLRSDAVGLIGKDGKAICFVLEVANTEEPEYLNKKAVIWKNWNGATDAFSELFKTPIPYFTLVVSGKSHPDMMDFNDFMEVVENGPNCA